MKQIEIQLDVNPPTAWGKNSKSSFGGRVVTSPAIKATKGMLYSLLLQHKPETMLDGPLSINVSIVWPYINNDKMAQKEGRLVWKTTKPDGDNVLATIKDVLETMQFYRNDALICDERIKRFRGASPCIMITLCELGENND